MGTVIGGSDGTPMDADEERDLAHRAAAGDRAAAERLVRTHLRLVAALARRYGRLGFPVGDLMQEGTIGLIQAVRRFNPDRNARLATYAAWWIRAAMQEYVVRSWSLVRVGKTAAHRALFFKLKALAAGLKDRADALSDEMAARLSTRFGLPAPEVAEFARRIAETDRSLDAPALPGQPEAGTLGEHLSAPHPTPEDILTARSTARLWSALIEKALAGLPAREAAIVRDRHLGEAARTFEAIGRDLGLSKDRVRQLEKKALERLRAILAPQAAIHGLPDGGVEVPGQDGGASRPIRSGAFPAA